MKEILLKNKDLVIAEFKEDFFEFKIDKKIKFYTICPDGFRMGLDEFESDYVGDGLTLSDFYYEFTYNQFCDFILRYYDQEWLEEFVDKLK